MSSISSITKAVSGLNTARKGLQVTAHNLSNVNTEGYTRQNLLQSDSKYLTVGNNGGYSMQVGLGVSTDEIRQIRDEVADRRLRTENSVLNYYQTLNTTVSDIETAFDEPYGNTISDMMRTFWSQTQKLGTTPDGVEERLSFISTAQVLAEKINSVSGALKDCQDNLNKQVISAVGNINKIIDEIRDYNTKITKAEVNGDNANDYRDERNLLLDQLSNYGDIAYSEHDNGQLQVKFEGHVVVDKTITTHIKLESKHSVFVKPVWQDSNSDVYSFDKVISSPNENESGSLKALLAARGENYASADTKWQQLAFDKNLSVDQIGNSYIIPTIQKKLDAFAQQLADTVNKALDGEGISGYKGTAVFVTKDGTDKFTADNIMINPELTVEGGYNKLGTVSSNNPDNTGDNSKVTDLLTAWQEKVDWYADAVDEYGIKVSAAPNGVTASLNTFFTNLVTDLGTQGSNYSAKTSEKTASVNNIENQRQAIAGVSQDEEFSNMLKFQYAYNASARMVTMLDGMLDTIINRM